MNRGTYLRLGGAMAILGTIIAVIMLIPNWNGLQGSAEAHEIDTLFDVMIVLSSYVFAIVIVMLGFAVWKFRAKPGDESDGEPIHGNTKLEIAWTVIPTVIVLFGGIYSWIVLDDIEAKQPDALPLEVTAQQYKWTFDYPDAGVRANELHVPVGRQLDVTAHALDVLHSFWVPEWRIKRDLVPFAAGNPSDVDDDFAVTPEVEGSFQIVCTELCGIGHSTMRAPVVVESEQDFQAWLKQQSPIPESSGAAAAGDSAGAGSGGGAARSG